MSYQSIDIDADEITVSFPGIDGSQSITFVREDVAEAEAAEADLCELSLDELQGEYEQEIATHVQRIDDIVRHSLAQAGLVGAESLVDDLEAFYSEQVAFMDSSDTADFTEWDSGWVAGMRSMLSAARRAVGRTN